jgi:hypothetical protein
MRRAIAWLTGGNRRDPVAASIRRHERRHGNEPESPGMSPDRLPALAPLPSGKHGIDQVTGAVVSREGRIASTMTKAEFIAGPLFLDGDWTNEKAGWYSASCGLLTFDDVQLGASVMFEHETLRYVSLWSNEPAFGTSWADYSRDKEIARHSWHVSWLTSQLGNWGRQFPWGRISAGGYDGKSGQSVIALYYEPMKEPWGVVPALRRGTTYIVETPFSDEHGQHFQKDEWLTYTGSDFLPHVGGVTLHFGKRTIYLHEQMHNDIIMNIGRYLRPADHHD